MEANGLETLYDAEQDKVAQATLGALPEGAKTGAAVKVVKLLAQSTGDFTREELRKDVKFAWTDKTKAEIAAAKEAAGGNGATPTGSSTGGNGSSTGGNTGDDNTGGGGDNGDEPDQ